MTPPPTTSWWNNPILLCVLVTLMAVPLIYPAIPPLIDLPGHMARYKIELDLHHSPYLRQWFSFQWALIGNLGVDLLIMPMAKLFGLEMGLKLIVLAIPPLTLSGMLYVGREIHRELPPTYLFAVPLAYNYPFQFGFLNFTLGMAAVLIAAGLWLHMDRLGQRRLRAALFVPIGFGLFIIHSAAWGMFCLIVLALEFWLGGIGRISGKRIVDRAVICIPAFLPSLLLFRWWSKDPSAATIGVFRWGEKLYFFLSIFRNSNLAFDMLSLLVPCIAIYIGLRRHGLRLEPRLGFAALLLLAAFLLMPTMVLGSSFADMRMAPYVLMVATLSLVPTTSKVKSLTLIAAAGLAFVAVRLGSQIWFYVELDREYRYQLAALDHVPEGARIFAMSDVPCTFDWGNARLDNVGQMAIIRREAFVNGQWMMPGSPLLGIHYHSAGEFAANPSNVLEPKECRRREGHSLEYSLRHLPRHAFDYVWLIGVPPGQWLEDAGLQPIWRGERGILYRIRKG